MKCGKPHCRDDCIYDPVLSNPVSSFIAVLNCAGKDGNDPVFRGPNGQTYPAPDSFDDYRSIHSSDLFCEPILDLLRLARVPRVCVTLFQ